MANDPDWLEAATRVYLALDRPGQEAEAYLQLGRAHPEAMARAMAILERTGNGPRPDLQPLGRWPIADKKALRPVLAAVPGPGGSAYLLVEDGLQHMGADGRILKVESVPGARDLTLDASGTPLALGEDSVRWGDAAIRLPAAISKPVSAAPAPDGSFFVLARGEPRLFRVNRKGASMGSVPVALDEPVRVRVDAAGRIYLADGDTGQVRIYGADMAPVRTVTLVEAGRPLRRLEDLTVDFAGNLMAVDGSTKEALLFTGAGQLLASTGQGVRADAVGWDGLHAMVVLDRREGVLWRYGS